MGLVKNFIIKMSLSAVFLLLFSLRFVDMTIGESIIEYPLETAWKVTGLPLEEISTETWFKYSDHWLNVYDLKIVAEEIKTKLQVTAKTPNTIGEQNEFNFISFEGLKPDGTVVTITIQSSGVNGTGETQVGINTWYRGKMSNIRQYIQSLKTQLVKLGSKPHINVIFSGKRPGRISMIMAKELTGKAFRKIDAQLVDTGFTSGNSSHKGYTRRINDSVLYYNKRVNIEIETHYDEARNITEIIMASPETTEGV
jgi:hypothetical protein